DAPVAGNHLIDVRAVAEVVINTITYLGPERSVVAGRGSFPEKLNRLFSLVPGPFKLQPVTAFCVQPKLRNVFPLEPALSPVVDDELTVNPKFYVTVRIGLKEIITTHLGLNRTLPTHTDIAGCRQ